MAAMRPDSPQPLVSVRVLTYNHESYIAQCLEGALMQRTSFPFEIIVGEDCSTDRTREIVLAYGKAHPDRIQVLLSEANAGAAANDRRVEQACRGRYHAFCEGDDYWIDPRKLQKQADFLDAHPDISMCFHDAFVVRHDRSAIPDYLCRPGLPPRLTMADLLRWQLAVPLAGVMVRAEIVLGLPGWCGEIRYSDLLFRLWCAHRGDLAYLDEAMSVYRIHPGGVIMSNASLEKHFSGIIDVYRRFDAETGGRYAAMIGPTIRRVRKEHRLAGLKEKWGPFRFLLRPEEALGRIRKYRGLFRRYKNMYRN